MNSDHDVLSVVVELAIFMVADLVIERDLVDDDPPAALGVPEPHGLDILHSRGTEGALVVVPVLPAVHVTGGVVIDSRVCRILSK